MANVLQWAGRAVGSLKEAWDELLHPRGPDGRFIKKWGMGEKAARQVVDVLSKARVRTFPSDGAAGQYAFNQHHKAAKPGWNQDRFVRDFEGVNTALRLGKTDAVTARYTKMMDDSGMPLEDDLIITKMVAPEAFGLGPDAFTPKPLPEAPDRMVTDVENLTGKLIADRGYTSGGIGTEYNNPAGANKIRMITLAPKGTKALFPGSTATDRQVVLDKDTPLRVTHVQADGQGGFHVYTVATPKVAGETPKPMDAQAGQPARFVPEPGKLTMTPEQMVSNLTSLEGRDLKDRAANVGVEATGSDPEIRNRIRARAKEARNRPAAPSAPPPQQGPEAAAPQAPAQASPTVAPAPGPAPTPAAPGGPAPRSEQVQSEAMGGGAPAAPGAPGAPGAPAAPEAQAPATMSGRHFGELVRESGMPSPSAGKRRREFNAALLGITSGKKDPADMLRELDSDIAVNRRIQAEGSGDGELERDIEIQDQLADLISESFDVPRRPQETPPPRPTPVVRPQRAVPGENIEAPPPRPIQETTATSFKEEQARRRAARGAPEPLPSAPEPLRRAGITPAERPAKKVAPAKKAARKAQPGKLQRTEAAEAGDIDAMTKQELLAEAEKRDVQVATSWSKDRIKQALRGEGEAPRKQAPRKRAPIPGTPEFEESIAEDIAQADRWVDDSGVPKSQVTALQLAALRILSNETRTKKRGKASEVRRLREIFGEDTNFVKILDSIDVTPAKRTPAKKATSAPAKKATPAPAKAKTLRDRAIDSLNEQDIFDPSPEMVREQMRTLRDVEASDLVRARSGGGAPLAKRTPGGAPTDPAALGRRKQFVGLAGDRGATPAAASEARNKAETDFANGRDPKEIAADLRATATRLTRSGQREDAQYLRDLARKVAAPPKKAAAPATPKPAPITKADLQKQADDLGLKYRKADTKAQLEQMIANAPEGAKRDTTKDLPKEAIRGNEPLNEARGAEFADAWDKLADKHAAVPEGAAKRATDEVIGDIRTGAISPSEGLRRLENDIDFNRTDLIDMERELRANPGNKDLADRIQKLKQGTAGQARASNFLRSHFKSEPSITQQELDEVKADPQVGRDLAAAVGGMDKTTLGDMLKAATPKDTEDLRRQVNANPDLGPARGDTAEEIFDNAIKEMIRKKLAGEFDKPTKKVKAPERPAGKPLNTPDVREIATGLNVPEEQLKLIQDDLDNPKLTPAKVGRDLEQFLKTSPVAPLGKRAILRAHLERRDTPPTPEEQAELDALTEQDAEMRKLAERLKVTRRKRATAPKPEPAKLTPEENKQARQAADLAGVPEDRVKARMTERKEDKAAPSEHAKGVADLLRVTGTREEGQDLLKGRTKNELKDIAKAAGVSYGSNYTSQKLKDEIVRWTIGRRLESDAIIGRPSGPETTPRPSRTPREIIDALNALPTRDAARPEVDALSTSDLRAIAREMNIPRASGMKVPDLRREVVDATVGRRIDTAATRQFDAGIGSPMDAPLPSKAPDIDESVALRGDPEGDNMRMHGDSLTMRLAQEYAKAGRNGSANRIMDLRRRSTARTNSISPQQTVDELKQILAEEEDPSFRQRLERAIKGIDAPMTPLPDIPENTPPAARKLLEDLHAIPYARKTKGDFAGAGTIRGDSLVEQVAQVYRDAAAGTRGDDGRSPSDRLANILRQQVHESNEASFRIWDLENRLKAEDGKPSPLVTELRQLERGQLSAPTSTPAPAASAGVPRSNSGRIMGYLPDQIREMSLPRLHTLATHLGLSGWQDMNKEELLNVILGEG